MLLLRGRCRSRTVRGSGSRFHCRPDRCPAVRRSRDDSGCRGPHGRQRRCGRLRLSRPPGWRLRDSATSRTQTASLESARHGASARPAHVPDVAGPSRQFDVDFTVRLYDRRACELAQRPACRRDDVVPERTAATSSACVGTCQCSSRQPIIETVSELCQIPPETPVEPSDLRGHSDAHRCCEKSLIWNVRWWLLVWVSTRERNQFPSVLLQPLGHLSVRVESTVYRKAATRCKSKL